MGDNNRQFDVIVIGSGISGGWAAKEFCEKGLKTLVLERGRDVQHLKDYPTTNMMPWEFEHRGEVPHDIQKDNPVVSRCYAFREDAMHFFVKDTDHPYVQDKPFDWIRGYQVGGKSLLWARQTQRWSEYDFEGPARDGFAVDWPIRYKDLAPWYSYVEKFAGISGNRDGLDILPDGEFLPPLELSCVENHFKDVVAKNFPGRHVIYGRCAHLTQPQPIHLEQGRAQCQKRNLCQRGCPFGGYFSSNATTIPWAMKTGNMTLRPHSVVQSVIYDDKKGKATGVRVIDAQTKEDPSAAYRSRLEHLQTAGIGGGYSPPRLLQEDDTQPRHREGYEQFANSNSGDRWKLDSQPDAPRTPYELRAGYVIPAIMIYGINSSLPGQIAGQVSQDVYDTATHRWKLIPQGSRLVGTYSSEVEYGQARVLVAWQRIIFPDGKAMDIGTMPGSDSEGYSGFTDQVNNHYVRLYSSAFLLSAMTAGFTLSQNQTNTGQGLGYQQNATTAMSQALGQQLGQVTARLMSKNLNISPTLEIRPGYRFNVVVTKDMTFTKPYQAFDY